MRTISHASEYSIPQWDRWLNTQGLDIADIRSIDVHRNGRMTVHRYVAGPNGQRMLDPAHRDDILMRPDYTFTPTTDPPFFDV